MAQETLKALDPLILQCFPEGQLDSSCDPRAAAAAAFQFDHKKLKEINFYPSEELIADSATFWRAADRCLSHASSKFPSARSALQCLRRALERAQSDCLAKQTTQPDHWCAYARRLRVALKELWSIDGVFKGNTLGEDDLKEIFVKADLEVWRFDRKDRGPTRVDQRLPPTVYSLYPPRLYRSQRQQDDAVCRNWNYGKCSGDSSCPHGRHHRCLSCGGGHMVGNCTRSGAGGPAPSALASAPAPSSAPLITGYRQFSRR
jgi:hypothetical protein